MRIGESLRGAIDHLMPGASSSVDIDFEIEKAFQAREAARELAYDASVDPNEMARRLSRLSGAEVHLADLMSKRPVKQPLFQVKDAPWASEVSDPNIKS